MLVMMTLLFGPDLPHLLFPYDVKPIVVVAKENNEEKYSLRT
jgi:hypothetical protein